MAKRVTITENEAWEEVAKYFHALDKRDDEYTVQYFMEKYGRSRSTTNRRLNALEKDGILTSRTVRLDKGMGKVYKFVAK